MKARFDAGTDVAMIGAWDAQRAAQPLTASEFKHVSATLDADAAEGHLFLLHTHADGGGPVDAYIDEAIPDEVKTSLTPIGGEFLLALPSGALVVDGAEYYRARKPDTKRLDRGVAVPAGDYSVRCYAAKDEEAKPKAEAELAQIVGAADLKYYDRMNNMGCVVGVLTLLLFPILWIPLGWIAALVITVVVFVGYFNVRQWILKRNVKYARLEKVVTAYRLEHEDPVFVLELRPVAVRAGLKGGSASVQRNA